MWGLFTFSWMKQSIFYFYHKKSLLVQSQRFVCLRLTITTRWGTSQHSHNDTVNKTPFLCVRCHRVIPTCRFQSNHCLEETVVQTSWFSWWNWMIFQEIAVHYSISKTKSVFQSSFLMNEAAQDKVFLYITMMK
jgi:hypothetical protein